QDTRTAAAGRVRRPWCGTRRLSPGQRQPRPPSRGDRLAAGTIAAEKREGKRPQPATAAGEELRRPWYGGERRTPDPGRVDARRRPAAIMRPDSTTKRQGSASSAESAAQPQTLTT